MNIKVDQAITDLGTNVYMHLFLLLYRIEEGPKVQVLQRGSVAWQRTLIPEMSTFRGAQALRDIKIDTAQMTLSLVIIVIMKTIELIE